MCKGVKVQRFKKGVLLFSGISPFGISTFGGYTWSNLRLLWAIPENYFMRVRKTLTKLFSEVAPFGSNCRVRRTLRKLMFSWELFVRKLMFSYKLFSIFSIFSFSSNFFFIFSSFFSFYFATISNIS